jgi:hypothetical protein
VSERVFLPLPCVLLALKRSGRFFVTDPFLSSYQPFLFYTINKPEGVFSDKPGLTPT